jgi:hypothetical protein
MAYCISSGPPRLLQCNNLFEEVRHWRPYTDSMRSPEYKNAKRSCLLQPSTIEFAAEALLRVEVSSKKRLRPQPDLLEQLAHGVLESSEATSHYSLAATASKSSG